MAKQAKEKMQRHCIHLDNETLEAIEKIKKILNVKSLSAILRLSVSEFATSLKNMKKDDSEKHL